MRLYKGKVHKIKRVIECCLSRNTSLNYSLPLKQSILGTSFVLIDFYQSLVTELSWKWSTWIGQLACHCFYPLYLYRKTLSTTTHVLDIRVIEGKLTTQFALNVIHFSTQQGHDGF